MVDDISKLYAKILEEQNEKDSEASIGDLFHNNF